MITSIEQNEGMIRLMVFGGVLALMLLLETLFPRKKRTQNRAKHIANNLGIVVFYTVVMRVIFPNRRYGHSRICKLEGLGDFKPHRFTHLGTYSDFRHFIGHGGLLATCGFA